MISSIEGTLAGVTESSVVVEVGGIGFEVFVPGRVVSSIGSAGSKVRLLTWLHVREDALVLFGFPSPRDRRIFLSLISISGIGPKVALGMLATCDSSEIAAMIHSGDSAGLVRLPGIGKKTAERIIVELKDRIEPSEFGAPGREGGGGLESGVFEEALAALLSIGLTRAGARKALEEIDRSEIGDDPGVEDIVRVALRKASS